MKKYYLLSVYVVVLFILVFSAVGLAFALLYPFNYKEEIVAYAEKYELDPALVASIINVESGFDRHKVSSAGAMGLMQLMPSTALEIAGIYGMTSFEITSLYDPDVNIDFGCYYLRYLSDQFSNRLPNILAGYNAGLNNVNLWLLDAEYSPSGITIEKTPYEETNNFLSRVQENYKIYAKRF